MNIRFRKIFFIIIFIFIASHITSHLFAEEFNLDNEELYNRLNKIRGSLEKIESLRQRLEKEIAADQKKSHIQKKQISPSPSIAKEAAGSETAEARRKGRELNNKLKRDLLLLRDQKRLYEDKLKETEGFKVANEKGKEKIEALEEKVRVLDAQSQRAFARQAYLENERDELSVQLGRNKLRIETLEKRVSETKPKRQEARKDIVRLEKKAAKLDKELQKQEKRFKRRKQEYEDGKEEVKRSRSQINELNEALYQKDSRIISLEEQNFDITEELARTKEEAADLTHKLANAEEKFINLKERLDIIIENFEGSIER